MHNKLMLSLALVLCLASFSSAEPKFIFNSDADIWTTVCKGTTETVNNSAVFQDDDELSFAVNANEQYEFYAILAVNTSTAADFKFQFTGPASPTTINYACMMEVIPHGSSVTVLATAFSTSMANASFNPTGFGNLVRVWGYLENGSNAGTVQLQWAQNTQTVVDTKLRAGSNLRYRRVSRSAEPKMVNDLNTDLWTIVPKVTPEIVNFSTTYQNDNELSFSVASGKCYEWEAWLAVTTTVAADFKCQFTGPSVTNVDYGGWYQNTTNWFALSAFNAFSSSIPGSSYNVSETNIVHLYGIVNTSASGTVTLQWAQNAQTAVDTTVLGSGASWLKWRQLN